MHATKCFHAYTVRLYIGLDFIVHHIIERDY